jgi:hypothetical protein
MKLTGQAGLASGNGAAPGIPDARQDGPCHRWLMPHAG